MKLACRIRNPCNNLHGSSSHHHHHLVTGSSSSQSRNNKPTLKITSSWNNNPKGNNNNINNISNSVSIANKSNTKLSEHWKEFQGINNWEGLLDPLHDKLRDEILRYGDFVEAAYRCFDSGMSSPSYATCRHPIGSVLQSGCGYRVTKHLHATSGVRLPLWARDRMPGWASARSSWIGYVAVCDDPDEISRLGRRDVVVAYRGTATCMEWLENLRASLTRLPSGSMVQSGFLSLYTSSSEGAFPSLRDSVREEIGRIVREYEGEELSITMVGHSLGAALAMLTARDVEDGPLVSVFSFGGPRVGDENLRRELEGKGTKVLRIVNADDPVTKVPGFIIDEESDRRVAMMSGLFSKWTQWVYAEIGEELRLSSRDCPHLSNGSVATCHDLKTYLHLVSTNCPLRATAKRVLSSGRSVRQEKKKKKLMMMMKQQRDDNQVPQQQIFCG